MHINWLLLVRSLVPGFLNRPMRLAWLDALVSPLRASYNKFRNVTDEAEFATKHSGLKIYLEKALNDRFDPGVRSIYIQNVSTVHGNFIYSKREARHGPFVYCKTEPFTSAHMYVYGRLEYFGTNDFVVNVSSAVVFNNAEMKRFINSFKPVGKRYTINIY